MRRVIPGSDEAQAGAGARFDIPKEVGHDTLSQEGARAICAPRSFDRHHGTSAADTGTTAGPTTGIDAKDLHGRSRYRYVCARVVMRPCVQWHREHVSSYSPITLRMLQGCTLAPQTPQRRLPLMGTNATIAAST